MAGSNSNHNHQREMDKPESGSGGTPFWETAVLVLSFGAIWAWWLARQAAYREQGNFHPLWYLLLAVVLAALVWASVRRLNRVLTALREAQQKSQPTRRR